MFGGSITDSWSTSRGKEKSWTDSTTKTSGSESIRAGTYDTQATLDLLDQVLQNFNLNAVIDQSFRTGKEQAQGAVGEIFNQYRETDLPQILSQQGSTGAYGSTAAQMLSNDAFARATGRAAELSLGVGTSLIGTQMTERQNMLQQFAQLLQANLQQNVDRKYDETSNTKGTGVVQTRGFTHSLSAQGNFGTGGGGGITGMVG